MRASFSHRNILPITPDVTISRRQRRVIGHELRDLVFRVCSGGGAFLGLMWALERTSTHHSPPQACRPPTTIHGHVAMRALGQCLGSSVTSEVLAWLSPVLVGGGVGALVGLVLASMIRLGRAPKPAVAKGVAAGRWIRARYPGNCQRCGCSVVPGDRIRHSPGRVLCASCGER
jgi:hypothetical protein